MIRTVLSSTQHSRLTVSKCWIKPPAFLFGEDVNELKGSPCVHYNIMEVIAHMLLDKEVVGNTAEHFAIEYEVLMSNDDRVIKDFHSAEYFRLGCHWVKENIGEHVKFLPVIISTDKTVVGEGATKTAFPCYISLGNLKTQAMCKDISTGMLGYLPSLMHAVLDLTHACSTRRSRMQIEIIESGGNNSVAEVH
jgi:hypothetical protein